MRPCRPPWSSGSVDPLIADQINRGMMAVERNWLIPGGIPGRPWYKHALYACRQTYAHLELPGLTEAAEIGDTPVAQQQATILVDALRTNTDTRASAGSRISLCSRPEAKR